MAYVVMAYTVMAYVVMALYSYDLCSHGLYSYGLQFVLDADGKPVLGADGSPIRNPQFVLDADGKPRPLRTWLMFADLCVRMCADRSMCMSIEMRVSLCAWVCAGMRMVIRGHVAMAYTVMAYMVMAYIVMVLRLDM